MGFAVTTHCPSFVRSAADAFKDIFPKTTDYQAFVAALCASIFGVSGYCNIARFFLFSPSVSALCSFFQTPKLAFKIARRHKRMVMRLYPKMQTESSRFLWVVDDTIVKKSGRSIWGVYSWWDHSSKSYVLGQKILTLGIIDCKRQVFIPVAWEILHRDIEEKENKQPHEKGWVRALALLDEAIAFGFPKFTFVADSWFAGEEFFRKLTDKGFIFVMEVRCNRIVESHGRSAIEQRVDIYFNGIRRDNIYFHNKRAYAAERKLKLRNSKLVLKVVAVANKKSLEDKCFAYYVTNRLTWNASKVWGIFRNRWSIEVQFRDAKQIFTLGEAAVRSQEAVELSIAIALLALTVIRLEQCSRVGANENQYARPVPAGDIVRELKLENLKQGISKLAHETLGKALRIKISTKLTSKNLNNKPTEKSRIHRTFEKQGMLAKIA